jgi:hypothetical protein
MAGPRFRRATNCSPVAARLSMSTAWWTRSAGASGSAGQWRYRTDSTSCIMGASSRSRRLLLLDLRADIGVIVLTNAQDADANAMAQEILRVVRGAVSGPATSIPARAIPPG